jgi:hypothetical protein
MDTVESLLRAVLATVGRIAFPPPELARLVSPNIGGDKQLIAFNLCDGKTPQSEIGKKAGLDKGNLSRSISRWIEIGIIVRVGPEQYPMHIYPLSTDGPKTMRKIGKAHV